MLKIQGERIGQPELVMKVMWDDDFLGLEGTLAYTAPEVYKCGSYSPSSDIYGLSIVLWEIVYLEIRKTIL